MRLRPAATTLALLVILAAGCTRDGEWDQLASARKHLASAPCGKAPAVAGVAGANTNPREVYLGDWVIISVCHLDTLMTTAAAEQQPLSLFVNGVDAGVAPSGFDRDGGTLTFILERNNDNKELWKPLLYGPLFDRWATLHVSVGVRGGRPLQSAKGRTSPSASTSCTSTGRRTCGSRCSSRWSGRSSRSRVAATCSAKGRTSPVCAVRTVSPARRWRGGSS